MDGCPRRGLSFPGWIIALWLDLLSAARCSVSLRAVLTSVPQPARGCRPSHQAPRRSHWHPAPRPSWWGRTLCMRSPGNAAGVRLCPQGASFWHSGHQLEFGPGVCDRGEAASPWGHAQDHGQRGREVTWLPRARHRLSTVPSGRCPLSAPRAAGCSLSRGCGVHDQRSEPLPRGTAMVHSCPEA